MSRPEQAFDGPTRRRLDAYRDGGRCVVIVRGQDRRTTWTSDGMQELLGIDPERFGVDPYMRVVPEDQRILHTLSIELRKGGVDVAWTRLRILDDQGAVRTVGATAHDHLDDPGIRGLVIVLEPISTEATDDAMLQGVQAVSTDLVVIQDRQLNTRFVGTNITSLLGYSGPELVAAEHDAFHPADALPFAEARERVRAGGDDERLRLRLRHVDGTYRTFDAVIAARFDDPMIQGLLIVARDVTDLARTERELQETRSLYESLVVNAPDPTVAVTAEGILTFASPNIERMLGHRPDELLGTNALSLVHPDDRHLALDQFADFLTGGLDEDPILRLRAADGSWRTVEIASSTAFTVAELESHVVAMRDITDRTRLQHRYDQVLREASGTAFLVDADGEIIWSTHGFETYMGDLRSFTEGLDEKVFIRASTDPRTAFARVVEGGPDTTERLIGMLSPTGVDHRWVDVTITNAFDEVGVEAAVVNVHDIDEVIRTNEVNERLRRVLETTNELAIIYDRELNVVWANRAAVAVIGPAPMTAAQILETTPEADQALLRDVVLPALRATGSWHGELTMRTIGGRIIPIESTVLAHRNPDGELEFISAIARDISERKEFESRLHAQARNDPLTGLPNRTLLMERLDWLLERHPTPGALLFLDLDQFKEVNDTRGHEVGDLLLVEAAKRLERAVRPDDVVARFGGDEFVVLLVGVDELEAATTLAERIRIEIRGPVQVGDLDLFLTASIGVAIGLAGDEAGDLVARADAAMYSAKGRGRDRVVAFSDELRATVTRRIETATDLRSALEADELEVWFQPVVDTLDGIPVSLEALVRWEHPTRGLLLPAAFIDIAEDSELIALLGERVIRQTCEAVAELGPVLADLSISVNVSARQLADPTFPDLLAGILAEHGIGPERFVVEITESTVMEDVATSGRALDALRERGVGVAVDDFGTGYSSLAYLQRFNVDVLKIDREFVTPLRPEAPFEHSLAAGIVSLGHSLGLDVIAEGVESLRQAEVLARLGCDGLQGFLFSPPVQVADLPAVLDRLRADVSGA